MNPVTDHERRERKPTPLRAVRLTHPERVLFPAQGITKGQLALYYTQVAERMLPHLVDRPLMLLRCPEGEGGQCFHQKHPTQGVSRAVQRVPIVEKSGTTAEHMAVKDVKGLIALVQIGALEIHTWGSRTSHIEYPDQLIFDLDPDEGLAWSRIVEAARTVRARLEGLGLPVYLKTTGGKGLHLVVPVKPNTPWENAKVFCQAIAESVARDEPDKYVTTISKAKRKGKTLIDYLRNARGATAVCPYSTRARAGAPVATPLGWDELVPTLQPDKLTLSAVLERADARRVDPWRDFAKDRVAISRSARAAGSGSPTKRS